MMMKNIVMMINKKSLAQYLEIKNNVCIFAMKEISNLDL
jgi:hypothetical protein